MENFDQIFTLLAENGSIGLNLDILETGVLNIAALVGILVYTGRDFLGSILQERKDTIVKSVQDAEDRLDEANRRLSEAQKQLSQAHVVISEIRNETKAAKTNLLKSDANIAKKEFLDTTGLDADETNIKSWIQEYKTEKNYHDEEESLRLVELPKCFRVVGPMCVRILFQKVFII